MLITTAGGDYIDSFEHHGEYDGTDIDGLEALDPKILQKTILWWRARLKFTFRKPDYCSRYVLIYR